MGFHFVKMHGLGNDFIVIDARREAIALAPTKIQMLADRRRGIGCDQIIVIEPPRAAGDVFLSMFNADGSTIATCGNGTRCAASFVMAQNGQDRLTLETPAGIVNAVRHDNGMVTVDMGRPRLAWQDIPLSHAMETLEIPFSGLSPAVAVSMGNPHAVFFVPDTESIALEELGPSLEHHDLFPERANIEFATVQTPQRIRMRVWERGTGITQACGSGACAVLVAAVRRGLSERKADIILDGGILSIEWTESDSVLMTGPVSTSFQGEWLDV